MSHCLIYFTDHNKLSKAITKAWVGVCKHTLVTNLNDKKVGLKKNKNKPHI